MPPQNQSTSTEKPLLAPNKIGEEVIRVDDKLYNAKVLADIHPGGELFVKVFAGLDATEAFASYHRRKFPHKAMSDACIGNSVEEHPDAYMADYFELCQKVESVLPRHKSFAPTGYFFKVFLIMACAFGLEFYIHLNSLYVWYLTAPLGFFMALIGLNIQHDANHGAVSRNPFINRMLGYSQNWIGGSSLDWIHQHVVLHHIHTNDVHEDPDIRGSSLLRMNPLKPLMSYQTVQHIYVFLLIFLFGIVMVFSSLINILYGTNMTKMSTMVKKDRVVEAITSVVFMLRWFVCPMLQSPSWTTFWNISPLFIVGGYYLAFFFIISHNFVGVYMFDNTKDRKSTFLYDQVASSSNVGGAWLCMLNGGLNYQIEHHLFPRIQHTHYPVIAPIVRQFCKERNIPYVHFPTISGNFISCVQHIAKMGSENIPINFGA
mmetsp:Transcript_11214/g.11240  ORF Transcript_11214/g.11240 Transcript_11214/m.11240 type:complete len:431 (+) Transcript_11214:119-1411(+)